MKILELFSKLTDNAKGIILLISVGAFLLTVLSGYVSSCNLKREIRDLTAQRDSVQNRLADESSLKELYRDSTGSLSEKYSRLGEDFSSFKRTAQWDAAQKSRTILAYQSSVQEVRLENQKLRGLIQKDSAGNMTGFLVDTVTTHYILQAGVYLAPPVLDIILLQIPDSSSVSFTADKDGYLYGQIGHSNPYIFDSGASFQISRSTLPVEGRSPFGWILGVGPVYSQAQKWDVSVLIGAKLWDWGIGAFIAQDTRGILILREF
jgi:hypothetical protein